MKFKGYKLCFTTAIHLGKIRLEDSEHHLYADTIFSAMCHEALALYGARRIEKLVESVKTGRLRISDGFPFCSEKKSDNSSATDTYYIPKPQLFIEKNDDEKGNSDVKKHIKKLEFIPANLLGDFLSGTLDAKAEAEKYSQMGNSQMRTMANYILAYDSPDNPKDVSAVPFFVGAYTFSEGWGLYLLVGYEDEEILSMAEELLLSVGKTGIGGKRSSGLGKFNLAPAQLPPDLLDRLSVFNPDSADGQNAGTASQATDGQNAGCFMTLSVSMADDEILPQILEDASYTLIRRSGFVSSPDYHAAPVKKKDLYLFASGSVFRSRFGGKVFDVSRGGAHPVYRYAEPLFLSIK